MNLDEIEDLIRRYLAAGVAVVIILVGPMTGTGAGSGDPAGRPAAVGEESQEIEIRDGTPGADGAAEDPTADEDAPAEDDGPPAEPPADDPAGEDTAGEDGTEDTAPDEDGTEDTAPDEDGTEDTAPGEDATEDMATEDATDDDPGSRDPAGDDPVATDDPGADDPVTGDPGAEEPAAAGGTGTGGTTAGSGSAGASRPREDFRTTELAGWEPYTGPGYQGQGERSPEALAVSDGVLTISGDARGTTGGMCWGEGQRYGRWEARVRAPAADPAYHALVLLWPDADDFPTGGQVDLLELTDPSRASAEFYLHFGEDGDQVRSEVQVDATRWHAWAVEWTAEGITGYVDGEEWFSSTDPEMLPPGPMHLCVQLDFFPTGDAEVRPSRMDVDWVRQYGP